MTHIETDNPLLQWRIWCYDITWQYWYIWLVVLVIAVWLISRHFAKRQREWDEYMMNERKKHEDFKREVRKYRSPIERDLFEKDIVEIEHLSEINPINKP